MPRVLGLRASILSAFVAVRGAPAQSTRVVDYRPTNFNVVTERVAARPPTFGHQDDRHRLNAGPPRPRWDAHMRAYHVHHAHRVCARLPCSVSMRVRPPLAERTSLGQWVLTRLREPVTTELQQTRRSAPVRPCRSSRSLYVTSNTRGSGAEPAPKPLSPSPTPCRSATTTPARYPTPTAPPPLKA